MASPHPRVEPIDWDKPSFRCSGIGCSRSSSNHREICNCCGYFYDSKEANRYFGCLGCFERQLLDPNNPISMSNSSQILIAHTNNQRRNQLYSKWWCCSLCGYSCSSSTCWCSGILNSCYLPHIHPSCSCEQLGCLCCLFDAGQCFFPFYGDCDLSKIENDNDNNNEGGALELKDSFQCLCPLLCMVKSPARRLTTIITPLCVHQTDLMYNKCSCYTPICCSRNVSRLAIDQCCEGDTCCSHSWCGLDAGQPLGDVTYQTCIPGACCVNHEKNKCKCCTPLIGFVTGPNGSSCCSPLGGYDDQKTQLLVSNRRCFYTWFGCLLTDFQQDHLYWHCCTVCGHHTANSQCGFCLGNCVNNTSDIKYSHYCGFCEYKSSNVSCCYLCGFLKYENKANLKQVCSVCCCPQVKETVEVPVEDDTKDPIWNSHVKTEKMKVNRAIKICDLCGVRYIIDNQHPSRWIKDPSQLNHSEYGPEGGRVVPSPSPDPFMDISLDLPVGLPVDLPPFPNNQQMN